MFQGAKCIGLGGIAAFPLLAITHLGIAGSAGAQTLSITPGVQLQTIYSDNIDLAPDGQEDGKVLFSVTPRVSIDVGSEVRGRVNLDLDYGIQSRSGAGNATQSATSLSHQLQANGDVEVIKQRIFVDGAASVSQQSVSNRGTVTSTNLTDAGNRTTVRTYSIGPRFVHHFGNYADAEASVTFDAVTNADVDNADSTSWSSNYSIRSGRRFSKIPWSIVASNSTVDNDGRSENDFFRIDGEVGYIFSRRYAVFQTIGWDKNDFESGQSDTDGVRWRTNFRWTPNPRTSVSVGYGEQFSGSSLSFDVTYRRRRSQLSASFSEDITTSRSEQLARVVVPRVDAFGNPLDVTGPFDPTDDPTNLPTVSDDVLVSQNFNAAYALTLRRASLSVSAFSQFRTNQRSSSEETVYGGNVAYTRQLRRNTSGDANVGFQISDFELFRTDVRLDASVGITHRLGRDLSASARYSFLTQSSDLAQNEFSENRMSLTVNWDF